MIILKCWSVTFFNSFLLFNNAFSYKVVFDFSLIAKLLMWRETSTVIF